MTPKLKLKLKADFYSAIKSGDSEFLSFTPIKPTLMTSGLPSSYVEYTLLLVADSPSLLSPAGSGKGREVGLDVNRWLGRSSPCPGSSIHRPRNILGWNPTTNRIAFQSKVDHPRMRGFSYAHSRSRGKDGGHTIRSAVAANPMLHTESQTSWFDVL